MKKMLSMLSLVVSILGFSITIDINTAYAQAPPDCAGVNGPALRKQMNFHAHQILVACGLATESSTTTSGAPSTFSRTSSTLGGVDQDIVLGGEGIYPHVTQSETQTWAQGNTIVVGYNDSRTAGTCYAGGSYSTDGGATWTDMNARPFCSGHGTNYGDPVLVYDQKHSIWLAGFLATGCGGQGIGLWTSPDGINWSAGSCGHNGGSDDRQSGWVDNNSSSPFYGRFYLTWNDFATANANIFVTSSDDGGVTWSAPVQVEANASFIRNVQVTTGLDGAVFIAGMNEGGGGLASRTNLVYRSTNGGSSWTEITMGAPFTPPGSSTCGYFAAMFPSYWRHMGWGDIGGGPSGVIHYAFSQHGAGADSADIYYIRSADNGVTWSTPTRLNTDTSNRLQWQPSLSVTAAGHVFVSWYDARNTTGTDYERWGRLSTDNGLTWQMDDVISDASSPLPLQPDPNVQPCYAGDYDRSFGDGSFFYTTWVDGRTFVSGNSQQDVFFDRIPDQTGPPPPITLTTAGSKVKGSQVASLSWTPTIAGDNVRIIRDGNVVVTAPDNGAYTDNIGVKGNNISYTYQVCVVETGDCSNLSVVKFGNK